MEISVVNYLIMYSNESGRNLFASGINGNWPQKVMAFRAKNKSSSVLVSLFYCCESHSTDGFCKMCRVWFWQRLWQHWLQQEWFKQLSYLDPLHQLFSASLIFMSRLAWFVVTDVQDTGKDLANNGLLNLKKPIFVNYVKETVFHELNFVFQKNA